MKSPLRCALALTLLSALPASAQKKKDGELPPRTEVEILKTVTLPEGYAATVFAPPPMGGYPTSVSAAIDGVIFVAIDENGSLGRDRNPSASSDKSDRSARTPGKVVRMRDTDGDGRADEFVTFAEMESPRGVIWDGPNGTAPGTLYVMHPPDLTAYTDTDGDGRSDRQETIIAGLGFGLDFRGADHTTNGCRLAIDGFIYIAVGDYGFVKARAKDGTTLSMRGGGIVRVRPDGTGFEIVSRGQRNIYDVAVSPTLDLFTRDNTNDGGGWNVRLSFVPPGAHLGYPHLFKNFPEDVLQPLADLGGGSPCGALWIDEPGLPRGLFTVEWGAGGIMYHDDLVPDGAGWKVGAPAADLDPASTHKRPPVKQNKWIAMTRPTDMDVDASGALFITSWEGATFNYNGPNAGYVLRVVNTRARKVAVPDLRKMTRSELFALLASESGVQRLAAHREVVVRAKSKLPGEAANPAFDGDITTALYPWAIRVAFANGALPSVVTSALFTLQEANRVIGGSGGVDDLHLPQSGVVAEATIGAHVASAARFDLLAEDQIIAGLSAREARVRAAAITALRRTSAAGKMPAAAGGTPTLPGTDAAPSILPLVADADPVVAHLAVRALSELQAVQPCLAALDRAMDAGRTGVPPVGAGVSPGPSDRIDAIASGALRALYGIYEVKVVDGLIERIARAPDTHPPTSEAPGRMPGATGGTPVLPIRRGILDALCRLANQDAPYEDPKVWWGTRPDTSGPVYQPIAWSETPKIVAALRTALDASDEDDARWLVQRMYQCKVAFPGLIELMLAKAGRDTSAKLTAIEGLVRGDNSLPPEAIAALTAIATGSDPAELRVRALRLFQRCAENGGVFPGAVAAFAPLAGHDLGDALLTAAFEDFTRGAHNGKWVGDYAKMLTGKNAPQRQLAATVLVNLSTTRVGKDKDREAAAKAVEKGFAQPEAAAALLTAIARTGAKSFAEQVKAHLNHPVNAVAESALFAFQKLGLGSTTPSARLIGAMKYEEIAAAVKDGGDARDGKDMFLKAGCIACHTITADEPPKGPVLSAAAKIYDRAALLESLLKPSAKLAQGFESVWVKKKNGEQIEGFVTREGGDNLDLRNIAGQTVLVEKADIAERGHREQSMMPEGLLNAFTPQDLANLLAWMESLR